MLVFTEDASLTVLETELPFSSEWAQYIYWQCKSSALFHQLSSINHLLKCKGTFFSLALSILFFSVCKTFHTYC